MNTMNIKRVDYRGSEIFGYQTRTGYAVRVVNNDFDVTDWRRWSTLAGAVQGGKRLIWQREQMVASIEANLAQALQATINEVVGR